MGLKIAVCIKPVPDPTHYDKIRIDPIRKTVVREGIPTIMNPCDKHAMEAALQLRGVDGEVTAITMAPPNAEETLREALAMGADAAILLTDRAFAGADTWATSYTLAAGLRKAGNFDIVITGTESADGATTQVPAQLAEWLEWPHLWNVVGIEKSSDSVLRIRTKSETEVVRLPGHASLPAGGIPGKQQTPSDEPDGCNESEKEAADRMEQTRPRSG
ncbi:MAG: hypothetical protein AB9917_22325 [Negativicutes bacterium]